MPPRQISLCRQRSQMGGPWPASQPHPVLTSACSLTFSGQMPVVAVLQPSLAPRGHLHSDCPSVPAALTRTDEHVESSLNTRPRLPTFLRVKRRAHGHTANAWQCRNLRQSLWVLVSITRPSPGDCKSPHTAHLSLGPAPGPFPHQPGDHPGSDHGLPLL